MGASIGGSIWGLQGYDINSDLGSDGVCRFVSILNFKIREVQKVHIIILFHIGLVSLNFHFPDIQQPFIFMISGMVEMSMTPRNHYS